MAEYIRTTPLERRQNKLLLDLVGYDLNGQWHSHTIVNDLRKTVVARLPKGLFDPQDLEHQVLFRLTTYDPHDISDSKIDDIIQEQLAVIEERLSTADVDLQYIFRGLNRRHKDLNAEDRLELKNDGGELLAVGNGRSFEVEFRKIADPKIINLFTEKLHYIHSSRQRGDVFGFFFKGDSLPWGVETTEPSIIAKDYKKDALLAHGIDPNKAIEITRLYLLPGSPKNSISILDGLVGRYYKDQDIEAMYTTTMPTYAKTKGATTAGGMRDVLLVKELSHTFIPKTIRGKTHYVLDVSPDEEYNDAIATHPAFPTLFTVETFMRLNPNQEISPLPILQGRAIYIGNRYRKNSGKDIVKETKFRVSDTASCLQNLRAHAQFVDISYVKDEFWKNGDKPRIRLRIQDSFGSQHVEVSKKYRLSQEQHVRTEVIESLYNGSSMREALNTIAQQGDYRAKNSYEKISISYRGNSCSLQLNIYPFGAFVEISGDEASIWKTAALLGFSRADSIAKNADESYLEWNHGTGLKELLHITFGLDKK